jgi:mono/diheme cytochrome c family protein
MGRRIAVVLLVASCKAPPPPAKADAGTSTASPAPLAIDAKKIAENACLSCHQEDMLQQQRLTKAQWEKTVTKMAGWGANLEEAEKPALVEWLAQSYGPDAGPYAAETVPATTTLALVDPIDDGEYANGDPEKGKATYIDKCSGCHGQDALGHIGVRLVDRPFLHRAKDVADLVRRGKGKMPPAVVATKDLADILAHLRTLKAKVPGP